VPGIDTLLIGTRDLPMELGLPGQLGDERIVGDLGFMTTAATERAKLLHYCR
jgi:hypothetical protein